MTGKRRRPWVAQGTGVKNRPCIGYFRTRREAEAALAAYKPVNDWDITLAELYNNWSRRHFENISQATRDTYRYGFQKMTPLYNKKMREITIYDLQNIIDGLNGDSTIRQVRNTMSQLYKEGLRLDIIDKNLASLLVTKKAPLVEHEIFTNEEINTMWDGITKVPDIESVLILLYTGMRISAFLTCPLSAINLEESYIRWGVKTEAGKNRVIPILPEIRPIIEKRVRENKEYLFELPSKRGEKASVSYFRRAYYYKPLEELGIRKLTPHSCRHTFISILNRFVGNKEFIQKIAGHASYTTTANIYTHPQIEELVNSVKDIKIRA